MDTKNKEIERVKKAIKSEQEHFHKCLRAMVNDYVSKQKMLLNKYESLLGDDYEATLT